MAERERDDRPEEPEGILDEVGKILEDSRKEDPQPFTITLHGATAFAILRSLYIDIFVSKKVEKFLEKTQEVGVNDAAYVYRNFATAHNLESMEVVVYKRLAGQIPVETGDDGMLSAIGELPEVVSVDLILREMDFLNDKLLGGISLVAGVLEVREQVENAGLVDKNRINRRDTENALLWDISTFLDLNNSLADANVPTRPSYTKFLQGLQGNPQ